ncbi:hypothetical protein [Paenibacillus senegalensis]|uniref:hypothetical protein n=1 Tax=Paenibacillus senegalensis TaxID=1465766 RepID=UPI000288846A|nr:hypothetical protein [Paenibacillus senegalensis]
MASLLRYKPLKLNYQVLNRWLVSGTEERPVRFVPTTMSGGINDWLLKGFAIHENPCRREFVSGRKQEIPSLPPIDDFQPGGLCGQLEGAGEWKLYFPWENPRVERSSFWMVPTHLRTFAFSELECKKAHKAVLRLQTCGSITLWVNEELITDFTPFTRNAEAETEVEVTLKQGLNRLVVCFEDLAERDTQYYFRIDYKGKEDVATVLPLGEADPEEVLQLEQAMKEAYFPKDTVTSGNVALHINNPLAKDIPFVVEYGSAIFGGKKTMHATLRKSSAVLELADAGSFGMEYLYLQFTARLGRISIQRTLALQVYSDQAAATGSAPNIVSRKAEALKLIAEYGAPNLHTALAILKTGGPMGKAEALLREGIAGINERRDCSDFFLVALFRIWRDYRNSGILPESFWEEAKHCILHFRYWMDEPGDDVMWFFSENHALLFHTCELLAGQLFPAEMFPNHNANGEAHKLKAEQRLEEWFERFFSEGLAEWNSSAYLPVDAVGLLHLYDLAENESIRNKAKEAMDLIYFYLTVNSVNGVLACTYGRSYEKELKGQYITGTTSMNWIGYGMGHPNGYSISNVALCLSDYAPPEDYLDLMKLSPGERLVFRFEQGAGGYAQLYHYKSPEYGLSSIYNFKPGQRGYQEHVVHLSFGAEANLWINHPGELAQFGSGRPSYWAGNGYLPKAAQYRGLALVIYDIPADHEVSFTHAYFPTAVFDSFEQRNGWYLARVGSSYAAIYAAGGLHLREEGPGRQRELISEGCRNAWILRVSDEQESGSYEQFAAAVTSIIIENLQSLQLEFTDPYYGKVQLGWNEPLRVNGVEQNYSGFGVKGNLERIG